MKKTILIISLLIPIMFFTSCKEIKGLLKDNGKSVAVTDAEIANGLKEALIQGIKFAVSRLNRSNGYYGDSAVKILFPPAAIKAANKLRQLGLGSLVDKFIKTMNNGAEKAAKEAVNIFVRSIRSMTLTDARKILFGKDNAATEYFRRKTSAALIRAFSPHIKNALNAIGAVTVWRKVTSTYNRIPFVRKVNTDIVAYTTGKAMDGLFKKVAIEEKKIRKYVSSRVTNLLKKVFKLLDK